MNVSEFPDPPDQLSAGLGVGSDDFPATSGCTISASGRDRQKATAVLINPDGLLVEIEKLLSPAKKTKSVWAKRLEVNKRVHSLEGTYVADQGEYLCRGIQGEDWAQTYEKLSEKYTASGIIKDGWERFDPKPNAPAVEATAVDFPFKVCVRWGELKGKPGDYVVRDCSDHTDVWIVDKAIFEASYEFLTD